MSKKSNLEISFKYYADKVIKNLPEYEEEYEFHDDRKWRFDFAFPDCKVAVELEGGVWSGGRHTRGQGFTDDCEKYNAAIEEGWYVLRYSGDMLKTDPIGVFKQIKRVIDQR